MATSVSVSIHDPGGPLRELATPNAPCSIASRTSDRMRSSSSAVGGPAFCPCTKVQISLDPTYDPMLVEIPCFINWVKYARKSLHLELGAADPPSPKIIDVTPCRTMLCASPSCTMVLSEWLWMSKNPGVTVSREASIVRA